MRRRFLLATAAAVALCRTAQAAELTVFAAASLTDAMKDIAAAWEGQGHARPRFNLAASSTLARQIEQGAPADLFLSADRQWMDWAVTRGLIATDTLHELLGNTLVLVMPRDRAHSVTLEPGALVTLLGADGRLALGDPANVPAGIYAKQALQKLGVWTEVGGRLAPADSVRSALLLVERGEAPAGIVYRTDAHASKGVAEVAEFPAGSHDPIVYPAAVTKRGDTPEARAFLSFLTGSAARDAFERQGFVILP